jgi:hypothetical protein
MDLLGLCVGASMQYAQAQQGQDSDYIGWSLLIYSMLPACVKTGGTDEQANSRQA